MQEKVVQTKTCKHCQTPFDITDKDVEFYDKISPSFAGKKYSIPTPTLCPDCRQQRRLSFRNERSLYKRKCDFTGKDMISIYSPDKPRKAYDQEIWRGDSWDPISYGKALDFTKSFSQQFKELLAEVPLPGILNQGGENNRYCNHTGNVKNSYLTFGCANSQECYYSYRAIDSEYIFDSSFVNQSSTIYQSLDIENSHLLFFSQKCRDCSYGHYLYNCSNCHNCLGCINLNNMSYCIYNKQYTKDEYEKVFAQEIKKIDRKKFSEFSLKFPRKYCDIVNSENAVGDTIYNSKNVFNSFNIQDSENIRYSCDLWSHTINCMDCNSGYGPVDMAYQSVAIGMGGYGVYFSYTCHPANDILYSMYCYGCSNVFGCIGLRNQQYCILNKQYTKAEYETLVPKIIEHMQKIGEWGEFFPSSVSSFGYNETVAMEYFPLSKEEALKKGFNRSDYEVSAPKAKGQNVIICEISGKPFRLISQELEFYRKHNLPLPHRHPDVRHADRMSLRNPRKLFDRKCDKCGTDIKTTYSPGKPEIVYCEACYNKEIYG